MEGRGTTITIFLVEDEPDGLRTVGLDNWTGQAVMIPRKKLKDILKNIAKYIEKYSFPSLDKPGLYFLVGKNEKGAPVVYIGESENLSKRLGTHHNDDDKDFWQTTVAFVSKDKNLTRSHAKYLESKCIEIADSADRYELQNDQNPRLPKLPISDQAATEKYLDYVKLLLSSVGYPILQELQKPQEPVHKADEEIEPEPISDDSLFTCGGKKNGAKAKGYWSNEGFVVYKGSTANAQVLNTFPHSAKKLTEKLLSENILKKHNNKKLYIFVKNYIFPTPSSASNIILGRPSNGWAEWKTEDGKTLHEIYRLQELQKPQESAHKADEEIEPEPISDDPLFICKGRSGAKAKGCWSNGRFVVYKGSTVNALPKNIPTIRELIKKLRRKKILIEHGGGKLYIFDEDYVFNRPSSASRAILGRSSNGWKDWKTEDGKTLDEICRSQEPAHKDDLLFTCRGKKNGAEAKGYQSNEGFVIYKGSTANALPKGAPPSTKKLMKKLRRRNMLRRHNDGKLYIFVKNYIFRTPSAASSIILGRSSNGWKDWKTEDGKTLGEIYRK